MTTFTDQELIVQLKAGDRHATAVIYQAYFPMVAAYVQQHNGHPADAEDVFQEVMLALVQKIQSPDFTLTASLKTYLYAIARNCWSKRMRDNRLLLPGTAAIPEEAAMPDLFPEPPATTQVQGWLARITDNCKRVLKALFFYQQPMALLAQKMGWKNKHTADNQKYKCLQQLRKAALEK
ncbi:RNA polymerase sigma factor, sigma-70 family [Chitinophaga eiseniae]|uniref:RNA polymerase sigma factor, sigma-70 family n=1 Tax=Chitinophaga eiseniae TaxID=634771 RepID=A0A1T4N2U2_9BACT|nr:sigma-70 family RNA polymerase sigma factor [Chitinophaga eiseniae]SJZ73441.1 RNA polymerase sigma factor, sigma-70 family [Chitinophaga eiseniae]